MTATVIRVRALSCQVCVPADWTDERVLTFIKSRVPCGTEGGWKIRRAGDPTLAGDPERQPCLGGPPGHVHVVLDA